MANERSLNLFKENPKKYLRALGKSINPDLSEETFEDMEFDSLNFRNTDFSNCIFKKCKFRNCSFSNSKANRILFQNCALEETHFSTPQIENLTFENGTINSVKIQHCEGMVRFYAIECKKLEIPLCNVSYFQIDGDSTIDGMTMECQREMTMLDIMQCKHLRNCHVSNLNSENPPLINAKVLENCEFNGCDLSGAHFTFERVAGNCKFNDCNLTDATMSKRWASLFLKAGVINHLEYSSLKIEDLTIKFKTLFAGIWQWLHAASFLFFVFPYAAFILQMVVIRAWFAGEGSETVTMLHAISCFIWTGGTSYSNFNQYPAFSFFAFLALAIMNIVRLALFYKYKQIESHEQIYESPFDISQDSLWVATVNSYRYMMISGYLLAAGHTILFFYSDIPIEIKFWGK